MHELERACQASLERSRLRRHAMAQRLAVVRRRRRRSGSTSVAVIGAVLALGGPLALAQSSAQAPAPVTLSAGSAGSPVSALQAALGVPQTGRFSAATSRAVKAFQRRSGLTVDGIVGPQTAAALGLPSGRQADARAASTSAGGTSASAPAAGGGSTLSAIAQCESGGDPTAISSDGTYRGKYQFTRSTWKAMGGSGDPAAATEAEQDRLAAALLAAQGTAPWPVCGRGLS
ncbi:MAG TPA: transglycosylase family protein [Baekduia sp.]|jgi:peptidoglycan hydrolase-like protein with peptidoglycan-binding domain|nr:transglycosylase family protein [Baekduia sp.]